MIRRYATLHAHVYGPQKPAKVWAGFIGSVLLIVLVPYLAAAAACAWGFCK